MRVRHLPESPHRICQILAYKLCVPRHGCRGDGCKERFLAHQHTREGPDNQREVLRNEVVHCSRCLRSHHAEELPVDDLEGDEGPGCAGQVVWLALCLLRHKCSAKGAQDGGILVPDCRHGPACERQGHGQQLGGSRCRRGCKREPPGVFSNPSTPIARESTTEPCCTVQSCDDMSRAQFTTHRRRNLKHLLGSGLRDEVRVQIP
mmetsp:Transcript_106283/g.310738  ORF Transcript_106283/g.310738 Transcript_106283/m.310738 type:complete len:205 (-) Transcript_106283:65-679(-)